MGRVRAEDLQAVTKIIFPFLLHGLPDSLWQRFSTRVLWHQSQRVLCNVPLKVGEGKATTQSLGMHCFGRAEELPCTRPSLKQPPKGVGKPCASFLRVSHIAGKMNDAIITHFQFCDHKPEMSHNHNFNSFHNVGGSEEDGTGLPHPWDVAAGLRLSREAPAPFQCSALPAIVSLPSPSLTTPQTLW